MLVGWTYKIKGLRVYFCLNFKIKIGREISGYDGVVVFLDFFFRKEIG